MGLEAPAEGGACDGRNGAGSSCDAPDGRNGAARPDTGVWPAKVPTGNFALAFGCGGTFWPIGALPLAAGCGGTFWLFETLFVVFPAGTMLAPELDELLAPWVPETISL